MSSKTIMELSFIALVTTGVFFPLIEAINAIVLGRFVSFVLLFGLLVVNLLGVFYLSKLYKKKAQNGEEE